jgi:hypothetical protein
MLFRNDPGPSLAISQPAHAWLSGQLLRAWAEPLPEPLLMAAEQHDIGWLDWETAPSFDPATGRPHLFRAVGAAIHAPMWARGVERALGAWGRRVALLVSRHGSVIYTRFTDRHRMSEADFAGASRYLETQAVLQDGWARALGLDEATLAHDTGFVALSDTLSLALCGELATPLTLEAPDRTGGTRPIRLDRTGERFSLHPWPFRTEAVTVELEARPLPASGRFPDAAAMGTWHSSPERVALRVELVPGTALDGTAPLRGFPAGA